MTLKHRFKLVIETGAIIMALLSGGHAASDRPNLLFVLTDQHRRDGVGCYGMSAVDTPHLDQIAAEGIRFNRAYTAQPVCAPNRAAIMSGLYPHNHGVKENTWEMKPDLRILPDHLREKGYRTGYFGKWHLGDPARDSWDEMPLYPNDGRGTKHYFEIEGKLVYQTDVIVGDAVEFMETKSDQPFCVFASFYPPHPPYSVPEKYEKPYASLYAHDDERRRYYAMCSAVDEAVGALLKSLDDQGLASNTLVVFTTEHGHFFDHRWNDHDKRLCYDTSARIPMLMRFPGRIPAGQVSDHLICSVDLYQTMAGLLGLPVSESLDGWDLSGQLADPARPGRDSLVMINVPYIDKSGHPHQPELAKGEERCVIKGNWKLILSTIRDPELYDLSHDPEERDNLWVGLKNSPSTKDLLSELEDWGKRTNDSLAPLLARDL